MYTMTISFRFQQTITTVYPLKKMIQSDDYFSLKNPPLFQSIVYLSYRFATHEERASVYVNDPT